MACQSVLDRCELSKGLNLKNFLETGVTPASQPLCTIPYAQDGQRLQRAEIKEESWVFLCVHPAGPMRSGPNTLAESAGGLYTKFVHFQLEDSPCHSARG